MNGSTPFGDADWRVLAAAVIVGYLVGSISPATILARIRGVDLRGLGSGNPGATNVARLMGGKWGILVGLLDVSKGLLPALAFARFGSGPAELAGLAAVLGHITSPWLRGHGGKGVATAFGALLGVQPLWAVLVLGGFLLGVAVFRRVGMGAVFGASVLLGLGLGAERPEMRVFGVVLGLIVLMRHWRNIAAVLADARGTPQEGSEPESTAPDPPA